LAKAKGGSLKKWLIVCASGLVLTSAILWGLLVARERSGHKAAIVHSSKSFEDIPSIQSQLPLEVEESINLPAGKKVVHTKKYQDESLLYQAEYLYDGLGLRNTHLNNTKKKEHLIITGCSLVFGEGMNETETFPYLLGQNLKETSVYNFGIAGAGPHDIDFYLNNIDFKKYIGSRNGKMIYFYMDDHTSRASLYPAYLVWGGKNRAFYGFVNGSKLPKLLGKSGDSANWRQLEIARKTGLEKSFLEFAYLKSEDEQIKDLKLTAGLIANIQSRYLKQFPGNKFYFAFYPVFGSSLLHRKVMTEELVKLGVNVLDLHRVEQVFQKNEQVWGIPDDGHPSVEANRKLAELMLSEIKNL
jgi:hypothetical protein